MKKIISWVEIPTIDFNRAVVFYNQILQFEMKSLDFGTEKMACFPTGEGAVIYHENYQPASTGGLLVNLEAPDEQLDTTIDRIEANGGKIVFPKTKIQAEGRGYFVHFLDTEGNLLGMHGN